MKPEMAEHDLEERAAHGFEEGPAHGSLAQSDHSDFFPELMDFEDSSIFDEA